jgi:hypothetical protein
MVKNSRVKRVTGNGTWEGKFGLMYKFEIEMENGDIGENLSKTSECKFKEGQETEYQFIEGDWPKIKPVSNFQPRSNNNDVQENIRWAQSLNIANLQYCHGKINIDQIEQVAIEWYEKLKSGKPEVLPFS